MRHFECSKKVLHVRISLFAGVEPVRDGDVPTLGPTLIDERTDDTDDDETVLVLDCDGWQMSVSRDELPNGIDVEALPVTSV